MSFFDIALDYQRIRERSNLSNPFHLTSCETSIARTLLEGHTEDETADLLDLEEKELTDHLKRMCEKVGASNLGGLLRLLSMLPSMQVERRVVDIDDFRTAFGLAGPFQPV